MLWERVQCVLSSRGQHGHYCSPGKKLNLSNVLINSKLQPNTVHTFHRAICRDDTLKLLLKTLLKELFTNKGEILSCKSVKPCKNRKTHKRIMSEQETNPVQIPHPSKATFKFPPSLAQCTVKCPRYAWGGGC